MVWDKNDVVPAYSFSISSSPFSPLERDHIPAQRIIFKLKRFPTAYFSWCTFCIHTVHLHYCIAKTPTMKGTEAYGAHH